MNSKRLDPLKELSLEVHQLQAILALLHWDQETYMPEGANSIRSEQIALLSSLIHEKKTSRKWKETLSKLVHLSTGKVKIKGLSRPEQVALREWHKDFLRMNKLPASFVKEWAQVTSESAQVWASAKKQNNFKMFAPFLEKIVRLSIQKAEMFGFEEHPYDALVEVYEPCMSVKKLSTLFQSVKEELIPLMKKIQKQEPISSSFLKRSVSTEKQDKLGRALLKTLPIDPLYSRLDLSSHPFSTSLHPHDSRITSRILEKNFMSHLFSILHEVGHSLYEMNLPVKTWGSPLSEAASLSVHESQSRFWETLIGRSAPFWKFFYPTVKKELFSRERQVSLASFYRGIHEVKPSLIRVESDEVSYCLHVMVRFEIEKELISKEISVHDLPEVWRAKMKEIVGIAPKDDQQGCLQDIHWSLGDFGYFPTYALGNFLAAQLFEAFTKAHPDWEKKVSTGNFHFVSDWLKKHIHVWGRTYTLEQLAKKATKRPFSADAYCKYLKKKYQKIYRFR